MIEGYDGYTVVDLIRERIHRVVNDYNVLHSSVPYDPQVFYIIAFGGLNTVLTVESILEQVTVWVYVVKDRVSVSLVTCCEDYNLEFFIGLLKTLHNVWSDVDSCADCLFSREVDFKDHVRVLCLYVINAMDQCLIHVKYQKLLLVLTDWFRQVYELVSDAVFWHNAQVIANKRKGL
jgi:hypothetical protein